MYIKEIVLDGFKSYAQRTVVGEFDPQFNAITGFNGTGKSNILDSICFVFGITNLSQVRVSNLQELVYKQGQAGVTKATVTVVFDNRDKEQSPIGYEANDEITVTRQIVLGGRNKYLINGHNAQPARVQNLFHSVQLNINNPHFLIMQGRITKVLNMKPPEILSMIEEAAGTRLFETKKVAAQKTMEKKDAKLKETETLLNEEITPNMNKLKQERSSYIEFQKTGMEIEHLKRFDTAYKFAEAETILKLSTTELEETNRRKTELIRIVQVSDEAVVHLKQNQTTLEKKRDIEMGGAMADLELEVARLSKELVKETTKWQNSKENRVQQEGNVETITNSIKETEVSIAEKEGSFGKSQRELDAYQANVHEAETKVVDLERRLQAVVVGKSEEDGVDKTYAEQLKDARQTESVAATEAQQCAMKLKHAEEQLKVKRPSVKQLEKEYAVQTKGKVELEQIVTKIKSEMDTLHYSEDQERQLKTERVSLEERRTTLKDSCDQLQAKLACLNFSYSDPEKGFDRRRVSGLVAELVNVKDTANCTALEVTAGGKLFNVVVDNEETGKLLLSNGKLKRRVTIIPLSKIAHRTVAKEVLSVAEKEVGRGNVNVALSLVGYEDQVSAAMEYVFGTTLVCKTLEMAKQVTFHDAIRTKSVTLDGDVFDPAGTLTGGSKASNSSLLMQLQQLKDSQKQLAEVEARLGQIVDLLSKSAKIGQQFAKLKSQYEVKAHELSLMTTQISQSTHHQMLAEIQALEDALVSNKTEIKAANDREAAAKKACVDIEKAMKSNVNDREAKVKAVEKEITKAKSEVTKAKAKLENFKQSISEMVMDIQSLKAELVNLQAQLVEARKMVKVALDEEEKYSESVAAVKQQFDGEEAKLKEKKKKLSACDKELNEISSKINDETKNKSDSELELKKIDHKVARIHKDKKDAAKTVDDMTRAFDWIAAEKQYFGVSGTAYDFSSKDPAVVKKRLAELQSNQEKLSKRVNMKALSMFEKAEKEYEDLLSKKKIVEQDKSKIEEAIRELDEKKNEALKKAYEQVTRDFGSIFSTLLPGARAKLIPCEGQSVLDGLEVKVGFGDVWKDNLSELSGGQRSLVALSLVLSLLLFKPAPLYILDEVDSALDLSHTQNIGQMLRTHFKQSQFIVVSLKDGMFNNANVLFKTDFVDGISVVKRYTQQQPIDDSKENGHSGKGAKKGSASASGKGPIRALNM